MPTHQKARVTNLDWPKKALECRIYTTILFGQIIRREALENIVPTENISYRREQMMLVDLRWWHGEISSVELMQKQDLPTEINAYDVRQGT